MIDNILKTLGIESLSDMQEAAFKAISADDKDVVILSPTGSGKTIAYLLPLTTLIDKAKDHVQAVVVVPSRELAMQSAEVLQSMRCGVRGMALYGGHPAMEEHRELMKKLPHIVFATPGRLNDHLAKKNILPVTVNHLVIDEFDKCLALGFADEMRTAVRSLSNVSHRILLSATNDDIIPQYVRMADTTVVDFNVSTVVDDKRVDCFKVQSPDRDKLDTLQRLLRSFGSASSIVFMGYRDSVKRTADYLSSCGFVVSAYHGALDQKEREEALYIFANGSANVLVATDIASRGLDIPDVENIVHYHLPESEQVYIHRTGRTARWDAVGRTFFLLSSAERLPEYVKECADYAIPDDLPQPAKPKMATIYIGKGKKDKISKGDVVGFLCRKGGLRSDEIGRIDVYDRYAYAAVAREKTASVLRNVAGEKIKGVKALVEEIKLQGE